MLGGGKQKIQIAAETPFDDGVSGLGVEELQSAIDEIVATAITDHGDLEGLPDDDHSQYWIEGVLRLGDFSTSGKLSVGDLATFADEINLLDDVALQLGDEVNIVFDSASGDLEVNRIIGDANLEINMPLRVTMTLAEFSQIGPDTVVLSNTDAADRFVVVKQADTTMVGQRRALSVYAEVLDTHTAVNIRMSSLNAFTHIEAGNTTAYNTTSGFGSFCSGRHVIRNRGSGSIAMAVGISTTQNNAGATGTITEWNGCQSENTNPGNNSTTIEFNGFKMKNITAGTHTTTDFIGFHSEALTYGANNAAIALEGTDSEGSAIHFNWVPGGSTEKIYASATNTLELTARTTMNFDIADAKEMSLTENTLTFLNGGGTSTGFNWSSSGELDFEVAGELEIKYVANAMVFNNGLSNTGFEWATSGVLNFFVTSITEMSLAANTLTFNTGASDPVLDWSTSNYLALTTGIFHAQGGVRTVVSTNDVSDPPTDAELDTAFGTPATLGDGFIGIVDDDSGDTDIWCCFTSDTSWFYVKGIKAV